MKFKILYIILFITTPFLYSQSTNDYRTVASGNWTNVAIWEVYNGSAWVAATNYPGQVAGANDVTIGNGVTVTINSNITGAINSVTLGDRTGGIDNLLISNTSSLNVNQFTIAYDGLLNWTVNKTFSLPAGTAFAVQSPNPDPSLQLGVDHGIFENTTACSASKILQIGSTKYATCNGGGGSSVVTFNTVNNEGGNLSVFPTATPDPACANQLLQLNANPGGTEVNDTPLTYNWTASAPSGYSFSSTIENPTDTPPTPGSYTYEVTVTNNSGLTSTGTVTVTVENCNKTIITNRRITFRVTN
ncbi:hypothetical protein EV195_12012 [Tenacibaculum skagerrakense]|uniref:PKD domain-containing protein n=1 Tax=Tenacibaculum skagerrakense TaxID=186571 RepID=A0A4R2NIT1_9FLAO|nr:hypothetical protein [Tenacibaculum skagerrakense]TCP21321.1 hypothetical protein EV195_12012 [Tenacibaculum skagerrakense]